MRLVKMFGSRARDPQSLRGITAEVTAVRRPTVTVDLAGATLTPIPRSLRYPTAEPHDVLLLVKLGRSGSL